ncbi:MAG: molybdopterin-dependent oxidoreductase [Blastocatellia bacterium]|nr:molybdopterin-dependent oxidoreductase [Blastocatellia bacterium]
MASNELFNSISKMDQEGVKFGRRSFMLATGAAILSVGAWRYYSTRPMTYYPRKISFITPNRDFYVMSVNMFYSPEIDLNTWRLLLKGVDGRQISLSMDDIKAFPSKEIRRTFCCISNPVGGTAISNALWRVVSLKELLKTILTEKRDGVRMLTSGMDGFYSSVSLDLALHEDSFIAYEMNSEALPTDHGFPARMMIPGKYGMKQPKWLKSIELTDREVGGFYEDRLWTQDGEVQATTRLDRAANIETEGEDIVLEGIAFTGYPSVAKVEVSVDNGKSWSNAVLTTEPEKNVWTLWKYVWRRPLPGQYTVFCRVVDQTGKRQVEAESGNFPNGATGLHKVTLTVV